MTCTAERHEGGVASSQNFTVKLYPFWGFGRSLSRGSNLPLLSWEQHAEIQINWEGTMQCLTCDSEKRYTYKTSVYSNSRCSGQDIIETFIPIAIIIIKTREREMQVLHKETCKTHSCSKTSKEDDLVLLAFEMTVFACSLRAIFENIWLHRH